MKSDAGGAPSCVRRARGLPLLVLLVLLVVETTSGCPERSEGSAVPEADTTRPAAPDTNTNTNTNTNTGTTAPALDPLTQEALENLGYVATTATDNPQDRGVTRRAAAEDSPDLNLFSSRSRASALLVDMDGEVVHQWESPDAAEEHRRWMHVEPLPTGELLAISKDRDLAKHAWDSSLLWRTELRAHHDLAVRADGTIYALVRDRDRIEEGGQTLPILVDSVAVLSSEGELQRTVPLLPLFRDVFDAARLRRLAAKVAEGESATELTRAGQIGDMLHTNSIAFLDRPIEGVAPAGAVLLSFRSLSRIAILSPDLEERLWLWGDGELDAQHDATQLESGRLLVFDNGMHRGDSRAIEIDAARGAIVWSYAAEGLFSRLRGGAQRLPSGHTLITEADRGHVLEVTREGETVWEYWNPDVRQGEDGEVRGVIYRLNRFPRSFFAPLAAPGR